jgi:hypothetical protein
VASSLCKNELGLQISVEHFNYIYFSISHQQKQCTVQLEFKGETLLQGVTKRCRLSLLTNNTLVIRVQMRGEGGSCGVSANE